MGLGTPRDPIRLIRDHKKHENISLINTKSGVDHTDKAQKVSLELSSQLQEIDAFIFKSKSPSCGIEKVKTYDKNMFPLAGGTGIFARTIMSQKPLLPMMEEGRLKDPPHRDLFVTALFANYRLRTSSKTIGELQKFHQSYKFILLAQNEKIYRKLGPIVANSEKKPFSKVYRNYRRLFLLAFKQVTSRKKQTNAIIHIFGFLKKHLTSEEKSHFLDLMEQYKSGELPLIAVHTLIQHFIKIHNIEYILEQNYFTPYPEDIKIKNLY